MKKTWMTIVGLGFRVAVPSFAAADVQQGPVPKRDLQQAFKADLEAYLMDCSQTGEPICRCA